MTKRIFFFLTSLTLCLLLLISDRAFSAKETVRDPFRSSVSAQAPARQGSTAQGSINVSLEGISIGPKGALAVINGEIYREGEQKGGIKVAQIRKKEVDIIISGVPNTLRMVSEYASASSKGRAGASGAGGQALEGEAEYPEESEEVV